MYIGSSKDIEKRWAEHIKDLNGNVHHSKSLQEDWNDYGQLSFNFEIVEVCEPDPLSIRLNIEQKYLDELQPFDDNGYNTIRRIRGDGKNFPDGRYPTCLDDTKVLKIIDDLMDVNKTLKDIASQHGVSLGIVSCINRKQTWKHLTKDITFPDRLKNRIKMHRKLSNEQVDEVVQYLLDGKSTSEISRLTNVPPRTISRIRSHSSYAEFTTGLVFPEIHPKTDRKAIIFNRFTENDIREIYALFGKGYSRQEIADKFDVTVSYVGTILSGQIWKHVYDECNIKFTFPSRGIMIRCINTGVVYRSIDAARKDTKCATKSIKKSLDGKPVMTHNGYSFEYYKEDKDVDN